MLHFKCKSIKYNKKASNRIDALKIKLLLEATPGFEPGIKVLQTRALPLGYVAWSERRGSNPRPMPWQGIALSTELLSHYFNSIILLYYIVNNLRVVKVCYLVKDFFNLSSNNKIIPTISEQFNF